MSTSLAQNWIKSRFRPFLLAGLAASALTGCATGGDIGFPKMGTPKVDAQSAGLIDAFRDVPPPPAGDSAVWWGKFADPVLNGLVQAALSESLSVQQANQRLLEARAIGRASVAGFAPRVTASASADNDYALGGPKLVTATGGQVDQQGTSSAGVRATWEVPLFGRLGAGIDGARANVAGAEADLTAARIAIIADLAAAYIELRNSQQSLAYLEDDLERSRRLSGIAASREGVGLISRADKGIADGQYAQIRQRIPDANLRVRGALDRISILRGVMPGSLDTTLEPVESFVFKTEAPAVDAIPANFVRRRLDVQRAEKNAILAAAQVGISRADLYPSISITGSIISLASLSGNPLATTVDRGNLTPAISIPLFDLGQKRAALKQSDAKFQQALLGYRATTLSAIAEGQSALTSYGQSQERADAALQGERAAQVRLNATKSAFDAGIVSFKDRIEAESAFAAARQSRLASQAQFSDAAIGLYRTFAGAPGL